MIAYWIGIVAVIVLGGVTSYTDIRFHKIFNIHIAIAAFVGVVLALFQGPFIIMINGSIALVVGAGLWYFGLWSAADAKLFTVLTILLPYSVYQQPLLSDFPSFSFFINSFIPLFIYLAARILLRSTRSQYVAALKKAFQWNVLIVLALFFIILQWLSQFIPFQSNSFVYFVFLALIYILGGMALEYVPLLWRIIIVGVGAVARVVIDPTFLQWQFVFYLLGMMFFYMFLRYILIDLSTSALTRLFPVVQIQEGMVPAEVVVQEGKTFKTVAFSPFRKSVFSHPQEGFTAQDIIVLRSTLLKELRIHDTLPFAPFLFLGAIITVLLQGAIVTSIIL